MRYPIFLEDAGFTPSESAIIYDGLAQQAKELRGIDDPMENMALSIRDENGKLLAGLAAVIFYGNFLIRLLWVTKNLRGQGYGTQLMQRAEDLARSKDCLFMTTTTMDWEARGFYEKMGYELEFERQGYRQGSSLYLLRKDLVRKS